MSQHAVSPAHRVVLDEEQVRRTLSRIAHEIIERNDDLEAVALVGIHTRGVPLAQRLRRLVEERSGVELELGQLDITFHRDDVHVRGTGHRAAAPPAARPRHEARLRARGPHGHPRRRRALHRPHDPRGDRRADRIRAPGARAARSARRPRPPRASDPARTTSARTCRPRAATASRSSCSRSTRSTVSSSCPSARRATMTDLRVIGGDYAARGRAAAPAVGRPTSTRDDVERLLATAGRSRSRRSARRRSCRRCAAAWS